ncbi:MAG: diguanylate cyclase [Vogesella sp.]|uniref:GGDEF domain-containing protein n=1 Tax=Vogesella sp. TaxID=1904252 RepID=UPI00391DBF73
MAANVPQQNLDRLHWLFVATLLLFAVFAALFALSLYTEWRLDRANERRYQSYLLADELRQSSDDLTRMARSYIASGNPKYRAYYDEILAIRDGRMARPLHYNRIYWDLVFPRQARPQPRAEAASLLSLMQAAGFAPQEFARLAKAKQHSDSLSGVEREAMAMVDRADSLPEREAAPLRAAASLMLNDEAYFLAKARIMRPIDEVYALIEQRTVFEVAQAAQQSRLVRAAFMLVAIGLCLLLLRMRRYSREVLGCSLRQLYSYIVRLGSQPPPPVPVATGGQDTVLGWLVRTDTRLRQLAQEQEQVQQQLTRQANTDALTGLANRRALLQQLQDWLLLPPTQAWGLAYLDLDGFKQVNDRHGHAVGDTLLQAVAGQLVMLRPSLLCAARMGGDEFVLLLLGDADSLLHDMQCLVSDIERLSADTVPAATVSVSIGLLSHAAGPAPTLEQVLQQADAAMYRVKLAGKNGVYLADANVAM